MFKYLIANFSVCRANAIILPDADNIREITETSNETHEKRTNVEREKLAPTAS